MKKGMSNTMQLELLEEPKKPREALGLLRLDLIQGDCLVEMKNIPDKSVDMVLADPP